MSKTLARLVSVHKAFGDHRVLLGVSAAIPAGRCTFVVGPSGAGKSVLARHLVGLLRPDAGEVYYQDTRVDLLPEDELFALRRRVVYVFQHPTLFDSMPAVENVSLVLRFHHQLAKRDADDRALAELTALGLADLAWRLPPELSAGEQKMVSLARALALKPECLLLDEPTTGLDPYAGQALDRVVAELSARGISLLVISHDLRSLRRLAHEVVYLLHGGVRFHGPAAGFLSSQDPAVIQFLRGDPEGEI